MLQERGKENTFKPDAHGNRLLEMPRAQAKSDLALEAEAMVQPATASEMGPLLIPAAEYLEELTSSTLIFPC